MGVDVACILWLCRGTNQRGCCGGAVVEPLTFQKLKDSVSHPAHLTGPSCSTPPSTNLCMDSHIPVGNLPPSVCHSQASEVQHSCAEAPPVLCGPPPSAGYHHPCCRSSSVTHLSAEPHKCKRQEVRGGSLKLREYHRPDHPRRNSLKVPPDGHKHEIGGCPLNGNTSKYSSSDLCRHMSSVSVVDRDTVPQTVPVSVCPTDTAKVCGSVVTLSAALTDSTPHVV